VEGALDKFRLTSVHLFLFMRLKRRLPKYIVTNEGNNLVVEKYLFKLGDENEYFFFKKKYVGATDWEDIKDWDDEAGHPWTFEKIINHGQTISWKQFSTDAELFMFLL